MKYEWNSNHSIKVFVKIIRIMVQISWVGKVDLHLRQSDEEEAKCANEVCCQICARSNKKYTMAGLMFQKGRMFFKIGK